MERNAVVLGLDGSLPCRDNGMCLSFDLPESKKALRSQRISDFIKAGWIPHKKLESLTGRLPSSQTPIFGRFGRGAAHPLYRKLHAVYYHGVLSPVDISLLPW